MKTLELIYKRFPDRVNRFQQGLLYEDKHVLVTTQRIKPSNPITINKKEVLAEDFRAIWFIFADLWYDVGRIYNLEDAITGYYCDIIMPMFRGENHFEITDLCLDLWISPDGSYQIEDEEEFNEAITNNWIQPDLAHRARRALNNLISEVESGVFPPTIVRDWELIQ